MKGFTELERNRKDYKRTDFQETEYDDITSIFLKNVVDRKGGIQKGFPIAKILREELLAWNL